MSSEIRNHCILWLHIHILVYAFSRLTLFTICAFRFIARPGLQATQCCLYRQPLIFDVWIGVSNALIFMMFTRFSLDVIFCNWFSSISIDVNLISSMFAEIHWFSMDVTNQLYPNVFHRVQGLEHFFSLSVIGFHRFSLMLIDVQWISWFCVDLRAFHGFRWI